jgi:ABC-type sugar transport system permease subunit
MIVRGRHARSRQALVALAMLAPSLLLFGVFMGWPAVEAFRISLYNWTGFSPQAEWVGAKHFREMFGPTVCARALPFVAALAAALVIGIWLGRQRRTRIDEPPRLLGRMNPKWAWAPTLAVLSVWLAWWLYWTGDGDDFFRWCVRNNFRLMFVGGIFQFIFAFLFAAGLSMPGFRAAKFYRTMIFFPSFVSAVGVAILWQRVYDARYGLCNGVIQGMANVASQLISTAHPVHLSVEPIEWLGSDNMFNSIIAAGIWSGVGSQMILLVAAIQRIPPTYYEAARVDGANERHVFSHITLPMIREVILITLTLWVIGALKVFGLVQAMGLNQDEKSSVVSLRQYELAFSNRDNIYQMGYATAMAVVLLLLIVVFALGLRLLRTEDELEF